VLATWRESHPSLAVVAFIEEVRRIGLHWDGMEQPQPPATQKGTSKK
jgi:hypothetical protein